MGGDWLGNHLPVTAEADTLGRHKPQDQTNDIAITSTVVPSAREKVRSSPVASDNLRPFHQELLAQGRDCETSSL
jgi:hypothetical protein